jgi:hypothetical protein
MLIPKEKQVLIASAHKEVTNILGQFENGEITGGERYKRWLTFGQMLLKK